MTSPPPIDPPILLQTLSVANTNNPNEAWGSRSGLILAMAGNAVGLGNFLRFPTQATSNGGGSFMIAYFTALILDLGLVITAVYYKRNQFGGTNGH